MNRGELLQKASSELEQQGFDSYSCSQIRSCFDIAARREMLLLIKVLENIDSFTLNQSSSLSNLSSLLSCGSFIIGERSKCYSLEDGVVYQRYETPASNMETFKQVIRNNLPSVRKFRKSMVKLDGQKLSRERKNRGLSLKGLSKKTGISKSMLYRYEHEKCMASLENSRAIGEILGKNIDMPIDIKKVKNADTFDFHGLEAVQVRTPFNLLGIEKLKNDKVILGEKMDLRTLKKRAPIYSCISGILDSHSCFIMGKSRKKHLFGIPVISESEIEGISSPVEFVKIIKERKG